MFRGFCNKMNFNNLQHYRGQKREQKGQKREMWDKNGKVEL